jgi:transcription-repair coupling factor (superfamily II helicase)
LASAADADALEGLTEELVDRFGKLPEPAHALIETHRLRLIAQTLGLSRIDAASEAIVLQFGQDSTVKPETIIRYLQSQKDVRMTGSDRIRITLKEADLNTRLQRIRATCKALKPQAQLAKV